MRGPPLAWRGESGSECHLSAQAERFEGCLGLKSKEELMLRILTIIDVIHQTQYIYSIAPPTAQLPYKLLNINISSLGPSAFEKSCSLPPPTSTNQRL